MPTTLNSGLQLPDKGSVDWYSSMQTNYNLLDNHLENTDIHVTAEDKANWDSKQGSLTQSQLDAIAQVATNTNDIATLQTGKANTSHTHSSSDITDIEDYATKQYVDNSISDLVDNAPDALNTLNELSAALNDDSNFATTVTTALAAKADSADLASVATSGSYDDLTDKPTINDSTITIQKNGDTVDTFTTNGSDKTINIPVPTKTSDLTNDSDFVASSSLATVATSGFYNDLDNKPTIPSKISDLIDDSNFVDIFNPAVASGITSAKVTSYDAHIADNDIHVTTADKSTWNTVTSKANDSDVVHKSGNETIGGAKTFNDTATFVSVNLEGIRWKSLENQTIDLNDCYIPQAGAMSGYYTKDISSGSNISNKAANTSFILISLMTRRVSASDYNIRQEFYGSGEKYIRTCSNGIWTAWINETDKFVTTDTAQTITGNKTFSSNVNVYNSDNTANVPVINLKNSKSEISSSGNTASAQDISFLDKNSTLYANIKGAVQSNGSVIKIRSMAKGSSDNSVINELQLMAYTNGNKAIFPSYSNEVDLGISTYKWKSFNGLEPSSLSLPSGDASNFIDISSYFSNTGSGGTNSYTASANGWIYLYVTVCKTLTAYIQTATDSLYADYRERSSDGQIRIMLPIQKNNVFTSIWTTGSTVTVVTARFIPCQGNV